MKVAVVGGGINGIMTAWRLASSGCDVTLFDKGCIMSETSRASSKLLHGGLRYLEHGHFALVREGLQERGWWLSHVPSLVRPVEFLVPVFKGGARSRWKLAAGLRLYELLAIGSGFPNGRWYSQRELKSCEPDIDSRDLSGAYSYWDAQMDDYRLGLWACDRAVAAGVSIFEHTPVLSVDAGAGRIQLSNQVVAFDRIVNVAGPWAESLLTTSGVSSAVRLDLIRGSHLIVPGRRDKACVLQIPVDRRIVFLLPHGENTLLGTTEVAQSRPECEPVTDSEMRYLLAAHNRFYRRQLSEMDIIDAYAGVRPIVRGGKDYSRTSRESVIERRGRLISVFGGKWTTSRLLAEKAARITLACTSH